MCEHWKKIGFSICLAVGIFLNLWINDPKAFYYSLGVVLIPVIITGLVGAFISKNSKQEGNIRVFAMLSTKEKGLVILNATLMMTWFFVQTRWL